ncbi:response regulator [Butyrivibrio sp. LC3010]|uniref:response regulator n=1 Tax=Butyrivibrio sp. LC3010 TaxID=1280680 RepID=UPI00041555DC|nr:response regulator [Butyrivibrio sp. LC3010]
MKAICVDDENLILDLTVSLLDDFGLFEEVKGFSSGQEALSYMEENNVGLALLDIDMPEMDGMTLAGIIKEKSPGTSIIFLTGYSDYAVEAFSIHADGYLLKPIARDKLFQEVQYVIDNKEEESAYLANAKTFGNFDLFVKGESVVFKRSKSKELLAYLIDNRGGTVTRAEAFAALWEDGMYDRAMQKQMDVIVRSLKDTLKDYNISEILEVKSGGMRICPELIDCDLYHYLDGDEAAIKSFRGVYMNSYYWASLTEASLLDEDF